PVEFHRAVDYLIDQGITIFIEIGSHPVLLRYIQQSLQAKQKIGKTLATIKRQQESLSQIIECVFHSYLLGAEIESTVYFSDFQHKIRLPNYPWQRESYWHELTEKGYGLIERRLVNPLLGYRLKDADAAWENALDTVLMPWLADHEIGGAIVLPASAYLEMALAASKSWLGGNDFEIEEIEISAPIVLDAEHLKPIKFYCIPNDGTFTIRSGDAITRHVSGRLLGQPMQKCQPLMEYPIMSEADFHFSAEQHYQFTQKIGLHYGKAFQGVDQIWLWTQAKIAWAQLRFPNTLVEEDHYLLHPVLLDSCFQLLASVFHQQIQQGYLQAMIPVRIGKLRFYGQKQLPYWCKVELKRYHRRSIVADFYLWDQERQLIAVLQQVRFRSVNFIKAAEHYPPFYYYTGELKPLLIEELTAVEINKTVLKQQIDFYFSQAEITQQRQQHFTEVMPLFEAYIAAYCYETVQLLSNSAAAIVWDELIETATIIPEQFALLRRILFILEQEQWLIIEPNQLIWHWQSTTDIPESAMIWRTVVADYPDYLPELILLAQSAAHLPAILRGESHATAVLSPAKSSTYEHFYSASRTATIMNTVIVRMMKQWLTQLPENRRCRILCCSSGQAELTRLLIPLFPENRFDFILIDHHEDIIDHAIMQFESCLGFRAKQFNLAQLIHQLPEELNGGFDWIIVSHALHQLESISQIITVLQKLLIHNGYLLIQEREPDRFTDLTFGLQPDWWVSTAQQQFSSRLRPIEVWANYLQQQGFSDIQKFTEPEKWEQAGVFVLLAQNPNQIAIPLAILPKQTWLILFASTAITDELYQHLSATLTAQGHNVFGLQMLATAEWICLQQAQHPAQSLALWLQTIENYQQIIYLPSIEQAYNHNLSINLAAQRCEWMRQLFQAIPETSAITVSVVTKGGAVYQPLGDTAISPTEAAVWGLVRVAMNEYPNLTIRLFDLTDFQSTATISYRLGTALLNAEAENEWLISEGAAQVLRMQRQVLRSEFNHTSQLPFVLDFKVAGSLHNLYWRSLPATVELAANQIQIRPIAVGLNFRDVMYAMGLLADEAVENGFAGASLGMELAGIVERVGAEVKNFHQGDAVISFAPASFSTRVITQTTATVLKPVEWTFEQAATIPTTFFTVYYALHHLARLQAGEKILIHGAAGGVGLAAIQYAQWIGAEIFATAGSEEKRQFVKLLGADHVMDSRNMAFADQILQLTEGKGVDVILNSLSGEAIWRNLTILRPFGRFLELGKRDFYENSKIGLRPFRNNISYYGIDADQLLIERADLAGQLFKEMMQLFENKVFHPLPLRVFPAKDIEEAFRYMQQSRHIGKIVVSFENSQPLNVHTENSVAIELKLSATASYVVTGGLGGFGLKTAEWLVSKGAKHLWLLGRQGVKHSDAELTIQRLRDAGVQIEIGAVDVCDFIALEKIFERINQGSAPLKGVIHAAAVIDDALIRHLDAQQLQRVLAPKIQGAWNLHQLTQSVTLDFLVLYSSMTTFIGNPGQANYVAANHYLESLALYRRQQGLPALAVAWGAIEDVGFLTRHPQLKDILETRLGSKALTSDMALTLLEKLLLNQATVNAVFNVDWATLSRFMPMAKSPKYTQQIIQAQRLGTETHQHQDLKTILAGLPLSEAVPVVAQLL
ncbi:MAG: putative type polyketide synthase WcbR, partial [Pseudomonadota bacterium]